MSLNESKFKQRERWPLQFDLEGIPQEQRQQLMEENLPGPQNVFAADYQQGNGVMDINNPPVPRYGTAKNPFNEYPKMLYMDGKKPITVDSKKEEEKMVKLGYQVKPPIKKEESAA
jgi:hypothetical protein